MSSTASVSDRKSEKNVKALAEAAFKDGQLRTAGVLWQSAVAAERGAEPLPVHRLGQTLEKLGHHDHAAAVAVRLRTTHPDHHWATRPVLRQLLNQGRHGEARQLCLARLAAPDITPAVTCSLAVQLARAGDVTGAMRIVDALLADRPQDPQLRIAAATLAADHGHFRRGLSLLHGSELAEPGRDVLVLHARLYRSQQRFFECERICEQGLARFPDDADLQYQWASSAHAREDWLTAWRRWRALVRVEPSRIDAWLNMASALEERGHPAFAERLLRRTAIRFAHSNLPRRALARLLHARGLTAAAEHGYVLIRCAGLATVESDIDEARFLADQGRHAESKAAYAALARRRGSDPRVLRALALAEAGTDGSAVLLRRAIGLNEGDHESWTHLVRFLVRRGLLPEVQAEVERMATLLGDRTDHFRHIAAELKPVSPLAHTLMLSRALNGEDDRIGLAGLCAALVDQERFAEAEAVVRRVERLQRSAAAGLRAMLLVGQKRLPEALDVAAPGLRREPWNASAREALADVLTRLDRHCEVQALLRKTAERHPRRLNDLVQAVAKAAWASGDKLLALSLRQLAVGFPERSRRSELALGETLTSLAHNDAALSLFQRLECDFAPSLDVRTQTGALLLRQDRMEAGLAGFSQAAADQPINPLKWLNLALASLTAGDPAGVSSALARMGPAAPGGALAAVLADGAAAERKRLTGAPPRSPGPGAGGAHPMAFVKAEPLVAVVMSAYNAADTIEASLESVLAQSYRNLEILVVDDCSTDDTVAKIEDLCRKDSRVRLIRLTRNQGTYVARNAGIERIGAEYITFQDADDWSMSKRIEMQMDGLRSGNALCVYGAYCRVSDDGALDARSVLPAQRELGMAPVTALMRRRVLASIGYFDSVRIGADMEHYHRLRLVHGARASAFIRQPLLLAGSRKGSLSNNTATGHNWRRVARAPLSYERSYKAWHAACLVEGKTPYVGYPLRDRPFGVPRALLP